MIEAIVTAVHPQTGQGHMSAVLRKSARAITVMILSGQAARFVGKT